MTARDGERVCLGAVAGAHGIRGEVRIKAFAQDPLDIGAYGPVTTEDGAQSFEITVLRLHKGMTIARLDGVRDRNAAEALKGVRLYVPRARLPVPDEEDTWYHADLVGLEALDPGGTRLGAVIAVQDFGAGDLLEIALAGQDRTVLVPFTHDIVPRIDVAAGRLVVDAPRELLDPDATPDAAEQEP
jgi:16S rRNA processing protein RimM